MKRFWLSVISLVIFPWLLKAGVTIEVSNPGNTAISREVAAADWKTLQDRLPGLTSENARVRDGSGEVLVSQPVDNDGDGRIDELLFLVSLAAKEKKSFELVADSSLKMPGPKARAFARYVPERKDDFAWENDLVAFRAYGPALKEGAENCGIDCLFKRVDYPVLDKWYAAEKKGKSYHVDTGEGYDGYKVGSSLGCGGSAVWAGGELVRSEVYTGQRQFANGPVRAVFELSYGPWEAAGKKVTEKKIISIDLGRQMFKVSDAFFIDGKPAKLDIAVGVTTHGGLAQAYSNKDLGYLYGWEKIDGYYVGTAVAVAPGAVKEYKLLDSKKQDEGHALFIIPTTDQGKITYYAGFAWEKAGKITSREQWEKYLESFVNDVKNPVEVKVK